MKTQPVETAIESVVCRNGHHMLLMWHYYYIVFKFYQRWTTTKTNNNNNKNTVHNQLSRAVRLLLTSMTLGCMLC